MKIDVIIDFVCPYCFVAIELLWKTIDKNNLEIELKWLPYELVPVPEEQKRVTENRKMHFEKEIYPWAQEENIEIKFSMVDPVPRTTLAFEGLKIAEKLGVKDEYVKEVYRAFWQRGLDIGKIEVLAEIGSKLGIEQAKFSDDLRTGKYKELHKIENKEISQWDFEVVPTFYKNGKKINEFPKNIIEMEKILLEV